MRPAVRRSSRSGPTTPGGRTSTGAWRPWSGPVTATPPPRSRTDRVNAHGDSLAQALTTLGGAEAHAGEKATADAVGSVRNILALLAGFAVATGIVLALLATRSIVRPLDRLRQAEGGHGGFGGDLTVHLGEQSRDELGAVARSFERDGELPPRDRQPRGRCRP